MTLIRMREKLGKVRVSRAYEFYEVLKKYSVLTVDPNKPKWKKKPFEATSYQEYYVASDKNDAVGKECAIVLNREDEMWDCSPIVGSQPCYEFAGLKRDFVGAAETQINMRHLPCCCSVCVRGEQKSGVCQNIAIVGTVNRCRMKSKTIVVPPAILVAPYTQYTADILRAFIKRHRLKGNYENKTQMINIIRRYYIN